MSIAIAPIHSNRRRTIDPPARTFRDTVVNTYRPPAFVLPYLSLWSCLDGRLGRLGVIGKRRGRAVIRSV